MNNNVLVSHDRVTQQELKYPAHFNAQSIRHNNVTVYGQFGSFIELVPVGILPLKHERL